MRGKPYLERTVESTTGVTSVQRGVLQELPEQPPRPSIALPHLHLSSLRIPKLADQRPQHLHVFHPEFRARLNGCALEVLVPPINDDVLRPTVSGRSKLPSEGLPLAPAHSRCDLRNALQQRVVIAGNDRREASKIPHGS